MNKDKDTYVRRLERLLEASRLLNSTLELPELTEIVLRTIQDEVPVDRCTLFVLDRRQNLLRSFVAQGVNQSEITLRVGEGLAGAVAASGIPLDVPDVTQDKRFRAAHDRRLGYETRDVLSMPVFNNEGSLIAVLQLLNRRRTLDEQDKEFLTSICTYIGLAVQNAWVHHELAEARRFEQELTIVRDRLAQAEKRSELSELVTGIIHEMRNPLSVAVGQANLLREESDLAPSHNTRVKKIEESIARAVKIAQNFLNFARQGETEQVPTDLNSLINQTVDLVAYDLRISNVKTFVDLKQLPIVVVNAAGIQQVVLNLLRNAQQALAQNNQRGTISIRSFMDGDKVCIELVDDGPGIPQEVQERVFEPFFTTKPKGIGTGLGLAVSRRILEQHKGSLSFSSSPQTGTTFRIEIPAQASSHMSVQTAV